MNGTECESSNRVGGAHGDPEARPRRTSGRRAPHNRPAHPTDDGAGHYTLTVKAKAACPRTPQPLSYGWLAIILGGSAIVAYLVLGIAYNKKVRELDGLDLIPQWSYWQMLPGLVYDGVVFTHANVRWYMHHGQKGVSEYRAHRNNEARVRAPRAAPPPAPRLTPPASRRAQELKAPIAADE